MPTILKGPGNAIAGQKVTVQAGKFTDKGQVHLRGAHRHRVYRAETDVYAVIDVALRRAGKAKT